MVQHLEFERHTFALIIFLEATSFHGQSLYVWVWFELLLGIPSCSSAPAHKLCDFVAG